MPKVKIAVIGAGSFVFGPGVLKGVIAEHGLGGVELALMDVDAEALEPMAGVGRRMAAEAGLDTKITTHTTRDAALDGAGFVLCSAAPEMARRFAMDVEIIDRHLPDHVVTEFGGIAGIGYSLRQIAFIEGLAADMDRRCRKAWLMDVANPLPRVCQAAHELGVNTVGFCSVALSGYSMLWHVFHGRPLAYPFAEGLETWDATLAGLNHFCWVVELRDRATGRDLIDELRRRLDEGASTGGPLCDEVSRQTGFLLVPGDDHTQDFLPPHPSAARRKTVWHGTPAERRQRLALLADAAAGRAPVEAVTRHSAWEKPVDLIAAMAYGRAVAFRGLNLANDGQVANLPHGVFVETPCVGSPTGPVPEHVTLPEPVLPYCRRAAEVTDTIVRAALQRSRELVHEAVQLDPTITDKGAGLAAIDECLAAHADVLPKYE